MSALPADSDAPRRAIGLEQAQILQRQPRHPIGIDHHIQPADGQGDTRHRRFQRAVQPRLNLGHGPDRQRDRAARQAIDRNRDQKRQRQQDQPADQSAAPAHAPPPDSRRRGHLCPGLRRYRRRVLP